MSADTVVVAHTMCVRYNGGERYEIEVRDHHISVDQPITDGGDDLAPTPTELFVASLASCVAFYAGRYLTRHGFSREGLRVAAGFQMAADRPARVSTIKIDLWVPRELPPERWQALKAVVEHCTVHNSITSRPDIHIELTS